MKASALIGVVCSLVLVGISTGISAQKGAPRCQDIPTRWFIYPVATLADGVTTVTSAVRGDGNWYSSGSGTSNTVIHVCGTSPSRDATLLMSSRRKMTIQMPPPVSGSVIQESLSGTFQNSGFMNVRNILCVGCSKAPFEPFTTHMAFQLYELTARQDYRLRFMPFVTDAPDLHIQPEAVPLENVPHESSPVRVLPQPFNCTTGGTTNPSWIVRATNASQDPDISPSENLQVGTLARIDSKGNRFHAGQYSMPFEIRIEALSCFSY